MNSTQFWHAVARNNVHVDHSVRSVSLPAVPSIELAHPQESYKSLCTPRFCFMSQLRINGSWCTYSQSFEDGHIRDEEVAFAVWLCAPTCITWRYMTPSVMRCFRKASPASASPEQPVARNRA